MKDYNNEILKINNHVHLTIFKRLVRDSYEMSICQNWAIQPCIHVKKQKHWHNHTKINY